MEHGVGSWWDVYLCNRRTIEGAERYLRQKQEDKHRRAEHTRNSSVLRLRLRLLPFVPTRCVHPPLPPLPTHASNTPSTTTLPRRSHRRPPRVREPSVVLGRVPAALLGQRPLQLALLRQLLVAVLQLQPPLLAFLHTA